MKAKAKSKTPVDSFDAIDARDSFDLDDADDISQDGADLLGNLLPDRNAPEDAVDYSGDYECDSAADLAAIKKDFSVVDKERQKASATIAASRDADYTVQIVFLDSEQRDAFLSQTGWDAHGHRFINGLELAQLLGVTLPPSNYRPPKPRVDKTWSKFAMEG